MPAAIDHDYLVGNQSHKGGLIDFLLRAILHFCRNNQISDLTKPEKFDHRLVAPPFKIITR